MVAVVLAEGFLEKFGGDNMAAIRAAHDAYALRLAEAGVAAS